MSFQYIEEIEKTFLVKSTNRVVVGVFQGDKFIYELENEKVLKGKLIGSTSIILKGLDDGSIIQLN